MAKYYCQYWNEHFKSFPDSPHKSTNQKPTLAKVAKGQGHSKPIDAPMCLTLHWDNVSHRKYQTTVVKCIVGLHEKMLIGV